MEKQKQAWLMVGLDAAKKRIMVLGMRSDEGNAKKEIPELAAKLGLPAHQVFNVLGRANFRDIPKEIIAWIESQGLTHTEATVLQREVATATLAMVVRARLMKDVH